MWGTNTVPPMREGLVAIVPRPQTSVTGPAPIETPAPLSAIPTVPESARSVVTRHGRPGNPAPEPQTSISGLAPVSAPPAPDSGSSNIPAKPTVVHITVSSPSAPSVNSPGRPSIELPPANGGSPTAKPAAAPVPTVHLVPPPRGAAALHTLQPAPPPNEPGPANKAQSVSLPNQESDARHNIIVTSLPQHHQSPQPQPIATSPAPQITCWGLRGHS